MLIPSLPAARQWNLRGPHLIDVPDDTLVLGRMQEGQPQRHPQRPAPRVSARLALVAALRALVLALVLHEARSRRCG